MTYFYDICEAELSTNHMDEFKYYKATYITISLQSYYPEDSFLLSRNMFH
jgi:hypothetical protein